MRICPNIGNNFRCVDKQQKRKSEEHVKCVYKLKVNICVENNSTLSRLLNNDFFGSRIEVACGNNQMFLLYFHYPSRRRETKKLCNLKANNSVYSYFFTRRINLRSFSAQYSHLRDFNLRNERSEEQQKTNALRPVKVCSLLAIF